MNVINSTHALIDAGIDLCLAPEQQSRNGNTRELLMQTIRIAHPEDRCYILPYRNDNIFAKIAETLWVMSGRNDIEFLSKYLPRAIDYSDDGLTWRAGYGKRMRHWGQVDQLAGVVLKLQQDRYTRQAVMSLWDPEKDLYGTWKDISCNCWLHCIIRKNIHGIDELHMNIAQRSSDLIWGFSGINTFEFSVLQSLIARWLNCRVGLLTYNITSLHVYAQHYKRLDNMIHSFTGRTIYSFDVPCVEALSKPSQSLAEFDVHLNMFFNLEREMCAEIDDRRYYQPIGDAFLQRCYSMLEVYKMWEYNGFELSAVIVDMISCMPNDDFKCAAIEHIGKQDIRIMEDVIMSDDIRDALKVCVNMY